MELRHLEHFLAVAEEGSFTAAARRLHVVQSGVSAAVRALERELGAELFSRAGGVALTDAGEALLPEARATLDAAAAARDAVHEARGGLRGSLDVGSLVALELVDLPALLGDFHRRHPRVDLRLRTVPSGSRGLADALRGGTLDLAFLSVPPGAAARLRHRVLADLPLSLVVPAGHPLAGEAEVPLERLAAEDFVDFPAGYGNRDVVDRAFAALGVDRHRALEVSDTTAAARFVREGLGVALLPAYALPPPDDETLRVLPVAGGTLRWTMSVATSADRRPSAAARALLALVDAHRPG